MSGPEERTREFRGTPRFEVVRCIGAGGIGLVYEAIDREDGSRVAVKTLQRLDGDALLRFKNEFRLLQGLHHRNLVQLGELIEHNSQWFFTMELLNGVDFMAYVAPQTSARRDMQGATTDTSLKPLDKTTDLAHVTPKWQQLQGQSGAGKPAPGQQDFATAATEPGAGPVHLVASAPFNDHVFDEERLRASLAELAQGLIALHDAGKVHRDIKPQNVMVVDGRVVLLDFGLVSEARGEAAVEHGMVLGTPGYMSPEQAAGKSTTPASDWYGVGVMLYEALVGRRPFEGSAAQVMLAKQSKEPAPPARLSPATPADLDQLCVDLLRRLPGRRPTGRDVLARLNSGDAGSLVPSAVSEATRSEHSRLLDMPLIGREALLEDLDRAFESRGHGRPAVAFVHGNSGMGKTALVETFTSALGQRTLGSSLILRGRCYERESVPYKAFDGIVDELARYLKREDVGAEFLVPHRVDTLVRLFPVLEGVRRPLGLPHSTAGARDPQELRREAFGALKELLARIASKWPLVVLIDDVQWGDLDSAALLTEILSPPNAPGMLLIASYRSEESDTPLVVSLREHAKRSVARTSVHEIEVGPLTDKDSERLAAVGLQALTGNTDDNTRALAKAVASESAGSPFFVSELVRYLVMTEADQSGQAGGVTLDDVLLARRQRLSGDAREVLDVVAVAGRPLAQGVALHALGLETKLRAVFDELRAEHLVRTRGPGRKDAVECYHDRIRETMVDNLDGAEMQRKNRQLAAALEAEGSGDTEMLAQCYLGAGEPEKAAKYATEAAHKAEKALAFDQAAHMYRMALDIAGSASELRLRLGEALVNAGRGGEAAAEFLAAADSAETGECMDLTRRAAEQLLRSGRIDDGLALLSKILDASKLHVPRTDHGAIMSLALHRVRLRMRGLNYQPRAPEEVTERARRRVDICWAGTVGLGMVDPVRGADFGTQCLLMALDIGDESRIARTLAMEAGQVATGGGKSSARAEGMADRAAEIARRIDDPNALGLALLGSGAAALFSGRWRTAYEELRRGEAILRERCIGVAWEMTTLRTLQLGALYYLGEWSSMHELAAVASRQALERGDLYMVASLVSYATFARLADDDVEGARMTIRNATVKWSLRGYHVQHYMKLMSHLYVDLYADEVAPAWNRLQEEWPKVSRSLLSRVQMVRIEMSHGRARCALALAEKMRAAEDGAGLVEGETVESLCRMAASDARRMERERMGWAMPMAGLVRAALAAGRGQDEQAASLLGQALQAFEDADMHLFAAAARWRLGEVVGGERGEELEAQASADMHRQGIANPARIVAALAPGFPLRR